VEPPVVERINARVAADCKRAGEDPAFGRMRVWVWIMDVAKLRVPDPGVVLGPDGSVRGWYGKPYREAINEALRRSDPEHPGLGAFLATRLIQSALNEVAWSRGPRWRKAARAFREARDAVQALWQERYLQEARALVEAHTRSIGEPMELPTAGELGSVKFPARRSAGKQLSLFEWALERRLSQLQMDLVSVDEGFVVWNEVLRRHAALYAKTMKLRVGSLAFRRRRARGDAHPLLQFLAGRLHRRLRFLYPKEDKRRLGQRRRGLFRRALSRDIADLLRWIRPYEFGDLSPERVESALERFYPRPIPV